MTVIRFRIAPVAIAALLATGLVVLTGPESVAAPSDGFVPLSPARILDTRTELGGHPAEIGAGKTVALDVAGRGGVPDDAVAVALNVTAVTPAAGGYLTVYPADSTLPGSSNVNFVKGQTAANDVTSRLSLDGRVKIFAHAKTHVIVDVSGYFTRDSGYTALTPRRLLDTRRALGVPTKTRIGQNTAIDVTVTGGTTGVPNDAAAVALNVTATEPVASGYLSAYPAGTSRPTTSIANYKKATTVPALAIVRVGSGGKVSLFTSQSAHLVADVQGYFTEGGEYVGLNPDRVVDTRIGLGAPKKKVAKGGAISFTVPGTHGVPATGVSTVFLNVTSVNSAAGGYATVHASGSPRPVASMLNYPAGGVVANSILAKVGRDGEVTVFSSQASDVVIDVAGFVRGEAPDLKGSGVTVATWNLCGQDKCVTASNQMAKWNPTRKNLAGEWVKTFPTGIIATQESHNKDTKFEDKLPGYKVAAYRSAKSLFYDTSQYVVEDSGTITLDAADKKYAVWAAFRSDRSGARFVVVDAHLVTGKGKANDDKRKAQTQILLRDVERANAQDLPVVYAGDYNSNKDNANQSKYPGGYDAPAQVFATAGVPDSLAIAVVKRHAEYNSANQAKNPPLKHSDHVDHIYLDDRITVDLWQMLLRLDGSNYQVPFITDHNPIQVSLTVPVL